MRGALEPDLGACPALRAARAFAQERLAAISASLATARFPHLVTIALGGSLGRLEAHPDSDLDCLLIATPGAPPAALAEDVTGVLGVLDAQGLKAAKRSGIYRSAVTRDALLAPAARGSLDEAPAVFGKRMQLLLDARPVWQADAFLTLQRELVAWYGGVFHDADPRRGWTLLLNDLGRYRHAYAGWQQFKFGVEEDDSWHLRQAKLRSSRVLTFAGLCLLLGQSQGRADKHDWLCARLAQTPLGRVAGVMRTYDTAAFARLLAAYETTQAALADPPTRRALLRQTRAPGALPTAGDAQALAVREAEHTISRELSRFVLARQADWDPRFFDRLLC